MIKIRNHILFKTTALKREVKSEFALLSKSKTEKRRSHASQLIQNIGMSSDWLRGALLHSEISRSIGSFDVVCKSYRHKCLFTIMSLKRKQSVLSIKDKQSIILRLAKGEKVTNLSAEYGVSKQQISYIRKNKESPSQGGVHVPKIP